MLVMKNDKEGFTKNVVEVIAGNLEYNDNLWTQCNFVNTKHRRIPYDVNNNSLLTDKDYPRRFFTAFPEGGSTPETRAKAGKQLVILLNKFNKYPMTNVEYKDITDQHPTLDKFFKDEDIKELLELFVEKTDLTPSFKSDFPEFAATVYSGESYPAESYPAKLGF